MAAKEAARGGPLAYVRTGDIIQYDVEKRQLNVVGINGTDMSPEEIEAVFEERKKEGYKKTSGRKGMYRRYTEHALSAMEGAGY